MVDSSSKKMICLPGKRSLAKEKAAMVEVKVLSVSTVRLMMVLLRSPVTTLEADHSSL